MHEEEGQLKILNRKKELRKKENKTVRKTTCPKTRHKTQQQTKEVYNRILRPNNER
jgi:hypothetical protein